MPNLLTPIKRSPTGAAGINETVTCQQHSERLQHSYRMDNTVQSTIQTLRQLKTGAAIDDWGAGPRPSTLRQWHALTLERASQSDRLRRYSLANQQRLRLKTILTHAGIPEFTTSLDFDQNTSSSLQTLPIAEHLPFRISEPIHRLDKYNSLEYQRIRTNIKVHTVDAELLVPVEELCHSEEEHFVYNVCPNSIDYYNSPEDLIMVREKKGSDKKDSKRRRSSSSGRSSDKSGDRSQLDDRGSTSRGSTSRGSTSRGSTSATGERPSRPTGRKSSSSRYRSTVYDAKAFRCPEGGCRYGQSVKRRVGRHILDVHSGYPFACPHPNCESRQKTPKALKDHLMNIHHYSDARAEVHKPPPDPVALDRASDRVLTAAQKETLEIAERHRRQTTHRSSTGAASSRSSRHTSSRSGTSSAAPKQHSAWTSGAAERTADDTTDPSPAAKRTRTDAAKTATSSQAKPLGEYKIPKITAIRWPATGVEVLRQKTPSPKRPTRLRSTVTKPTATVAAHPDGDSEDDAILLSVNESLEDDTCDQSGSTVKADSPEATPALTTSPERSAAVSRSAAVTRSTAVQSSTEASAAVRPSTSSIESSAAVQPSTESSAAVQPSNESSAAVQPSTSSTEPSAAVQPSTESSAADKPATTTATSETISTATTSTVQPSVETSSSAFPPSPNLVAATSSEIRELLGDVQSVNSDESMLDTSLTPSMDAAASECIAANIPPEPSVFDTSPPGRVTSMEDIVEMLRQATATAPAARSSPKRPRRDPSSAASSTLGGISSATGTTSSAAAASWDLPSTSTMPTATTSSAASTASTVVTRSTPAVAAGPSSPRKRKAPRPLVIPGLYWNLPCEHLPCAGCKNCIVRLVVRAVGDVWVANRARDEGRLHVRYRQDIADCFPECLQLRMDVVDAREPVRVAQQSLERALLVLEMLLFDLRQRFPQWNSPELNSYVDDRKPEFDPEDHFGNK